MPTEQLKRELTEKLNLEIALIQERLNKEMYILEKQMDLIKNLKIRAVSINEWREICETPLRSSDLLIEIAKATFPDGYDFKNKANYVSFKIDDIAIELPTYGRSVIKIDMNWYKKPESKPYISNQHEKMRLYFKLLDSGEYTWYDLAKQRRIGSADCSKFKLFIWWHFKAKFRKVDRAKWEKEFALEDERNQKQTLEHERRMNIANKNLEALKNKVLPTLTQFSEVQGYINYKWLKADELANLK